MDSNGRKKDSMIKNMLAPAHFPPLVSIIQWTLHALINC